LHLLDRRINLSRVVFASRNRFGPTCRPHPINNIRSDPTRTRSGVEWSGVEGSGVEWKCSGGGVEWRLEGACCLPPCGQVATCHVSHAASYSTPAQPVRGPKFIFLERDQEMEEESSACQNSLHGNLGDRTCRQWSSCHNRLHFRRHVCLDLGTCSRPSQYNL
jgi:hypothetical protein